MREIPHPGQIALLGLFILDRLHDHAGDGISVRQEEISQGAEIVVLKRQDVREPWLTESPRVRTLTPIEPTVKAVSGSPFRVQSRRTRIALPRWWPPPRLPESGPARHGNVMNEAFSQAHLLFNGQIEMRSSASCRDTSFSIGR